MSAKEASQSSGIIFLVSLFDMDQLLTSATRGVFCFGGVLHEVEEILHGSIGMLILSGVPVVQAGSIALGTAVSGREGFMTYCAACHDVSGKGNGVIAEFLKITLTNLTQMSVKNGGEFQQQRAIEVIDGRAKAVQ
jgi:hypothetical protein